MKQQHVKTGTQELVSQFKKIVDKFLRENMNLILINLLLSKVSLNMHILCVVLCVLLIISYVDV